MTECRCESIFKLYERLSQIESDYFDLVLDYGDLRKEMRDFSEENQMLRELLSPYAFSHTMEKHEWDEHEKLAQDVLR